jgi:hypothetical protein
MGHALSNRNESLSLDRLRAVAPAALRDGLGLAGVAFWGWAWLSWLGSL